MSHDWVFNLAGLLAYNLLMSLFPILLVLLATVGFVLRNLAPGRLAQIQASIDAAIPNGGALFQAISDHLAKSAGLLVVVGVVTGLFAGSRLFVVLENCFGIIYRVRGRSLLRQNLMALGMLVLYIILIPLVTLASLVPSALLPAVAHIVPSVAQNALTQLAGIGVSVASAFALFVAIYLVVPNRPARMREVWRGTLVAAGLLVVYQSLFPLYVQLFLRPGNYGSLAGFAVLILTFFYYLAFILLLGAEVNAWVAGRRPLEGDLAGIMQQARLRRLRAGSRPADATS